MRLLDIDQCDQENSTSKPNWNFVNLKAKLPSLKISKTK